MDRQSDSDSVPMNERERERVREKEKTIMKIVQFNRTIRFILSSSLSLSLSLSLTLSFKPIPPKLGVLYTRVFFVSEFYPPFLLLSLSLT